MLSCRVKGGHLWACCGFFVSRRGYVMMQLREGGSPVEGLFLCSKGGLRLGTWFLKI